MDFRRQHKSPTTRGMLFMFVVAFLPNLIVSVYGDLPTYLLPSKAELVDKALPPSQDPLKRTRCDAVLHRAAASRSNKQSSAFKAFSFLVQILKNDFFPSSISDPDKMASKALSMIEESWNVPGASLDWSSYISLSNCAVDDKGRTMIMKMIKLGLVTCIQSSAIRKFTSGVGFRQLVDVDGNNLVHLAVMSGNKHVVQIIISRVGDDSVSLMESLNKEGKTPRDIASENAASDILDVLQKEYQIRTASAEMLAMTRGFTAAPTGPGSFTAEEPRVAPVQKHVDPFLPKRGHDVHDCGHDVCDSQPVAKSAKAAQPVAAVSPQPEPVAKSLLRPEPVAESVVQAAPVAKSVVAHEAEPPKSVIVASEAEPVVPATNVPKPESVEADSVAEQVAQRGAEQVDVVEPEAESAAVSEPVANAAVSEPVADAAVPEAEPVASIAPQPESDSSAPDSVAVPESQFVVPKSGTAAPESIVAAPDAEPIVSAVAAPLPEPIVSSAPEAEPVVASAPEAEPVVASAPEAEPVVASAPEAEPVAASAPEAEPVAASAPELEDDELDVVVPVVPAPESVAIAAESGSVSDPKLLESEAVVPDSVAVAAEAAVEVAPAPELEIAVPESAPEADREVDELNSDAVPAAETIATPETENENSQGQEKDAKAEMNDSDDRSKLQSAETDSVPPLKFDSAEVPPKDELAAPQSSRAALNEPEFIESRVLGGHHPSSAPAEDGGDTQPEPLKPDTITPNNPPPSASSTTTRSTSKFFLVLAFASMLGIFFA